MLKSAGIYLSISHGVSGKRFVFFPLNKRKDLLAMFLLSDAAGVDWPTMACYWLQNNTDLWPL